MKKKYLVIGGIVLLLAVIGSFMKKTKPKTETTITEKAIVETPTKDWKTMGFAEREQYILSYLKTEGPEQTELLNQVKQRLLTEGGYNEIAFDSEPSFSEAWVALPDDGIAFIKGTGTGKLPGVKDKIMYQIRFVILPTEKRIDNVSVTVL